MVRLIPSHIFIKDPVDVWGNEMSIGLAEHATRTYSPPMTTEKSGNVLEWDDFESGTKKFIDHITGVGTVNRSIDFARFGNFSLKCVTDAIIGDYAGAYHFTSNYHQQKIGSQIDFASSDTGYEIVTSITYYDGTTMHMGGLKWVESTGVLNYYGDDGAFHTLSPTIIREAYNENWGTIKIKIDLSSGKYISAHVLGVEYDLSEFNLYTAVSAFAKQLRSTNYVNTLATAAKTVYFDNYILLEYGAE